MKEIPPNHTLTLTRVSSREVERARSRKVESTRERRNLGLHDESCCVRRENIGTRIIR